MQEIKWLTTHIVVIYTLSLEEVNIAKAAASECLSLLGFVYQYILDKEITHSIELPGDENDSTINSGNHSQVIFHKPKLQQQGR